MNQSIMSTSQNTNRELLYHMLNCMVVRSQTFADTHMLYCLNLNDELDIYDGGQTFLEDKHDLNEYFFYV